MGGVGRHVHKLSDIDTEARTAVCANCGLVKIGSGGRYKGEQRWRCRQAKLDWEKNSQRFRNYQQRYAAEYYERTRGKSQRASWLRRYGLTQDDYDKLLEKQGGVCAICGDPPKEKHFCVDHCHESGKVRGLLCRHCNAGIGQLKDSIELVEKALTYLKRGA
jgi:hypothetical protein